MRRCTLDEIGARAETYMEGIFTVIKGKAYSKKVYDLYSEACHSRFKVQELVENIISSTAKLKGRKRLETKEFKVHLKGGSIPANLMCKFEGRRMSRGSSFNVEMQGEFVGMNCMPLIVS